MSQTAQQFEEIHIPYRAFPITGEIHRSPARIRVVAFGRRGGKSLMAMNEGFCMSHSVVSEQNRRPRGLIVAPTNQMLRENWWTAQMNFKEAITQSVVSEMRIELGPWGQVDFKSTESQGGAGRGAGYDWAVLDEASRIPKDAWEADIRPALADRQGRALIISTPLGLNWFYEIYQMGLSGDPAFASWHASTLDCWRSRFSNKPQELAKYEAEWELIRRSTSEMKFREEYLAEFLAGEGQLFHLKDGLWRGFLRDAVPGRHYITGIDVARKEDWMVTAVIEVESQQLVGLIRSKHLDWAMQKAVCLSLLDRYPASQTLDFVDSTGVGDPIAQDLRRAGRNVTDVLFTPRTKSELVENLLMAVDQCYLGIPNQTDTQWLIEELRCYESIQSKDKDGRPTGQIRYGAPPGRHDDGVTALMLAAWGLNGNWKTPETSQESLLPWWKREGEDWKWLQYEKQLREFRGRFPDRDLPMHPRDMRWGLLNPNPSVMELARN